MQVGMYVCVNICLSAEVQVHNSYEISNFDLGFLILCVGI